MLLFLCLEVATRAEDTLSLWVRKGHERRSIETTHIGPHSVGYFATLNILEAEDKAIVSSESIGLLSQ